MHTQIITHQTDASKDPHFIAFLPASVSASSTCPTLKSLASEIDPSSRVEGEVVTAGSHVPCFFAGKRDGEWVGLVSCAVFT